MYTGSCILFMKRKFIQWWPPISTNNHLSPEACSSSTCSCSWSLLIPLALKKTIWQANYVLKLQGIFCWPYFYLWKESLYSDGHQYQQTITSHLTSWKQKKATTYDVRNLGPGLGQTQKCDRFKPVNGILYCFSK
jgi:hypothetical protein